MPHRWPPFTSSHDRITANRNFPILDKDRTLADNVSIGKQLREAYSEWARKEGKTIRAVRLPGEEDIQFHKSGLDVSIHMSADAVVANMQTNSAGFEGWSLALHLWLQYQNVTLHWSPPKRDINQPLDRHYARFLYRVQKFRGLFSWLHIGTPEHLNDCAVKADGELYLNVAGSVSQEPKNAARETKIERALVNGYSRQFGAELDLDVIDRQFPVGLYQTADLRTPVFTGGTSAIDLVGVNDNIFSVIELKAGNNIMVGALGELLFYAAVIRDAAGPESRFKFGGRPNGGTRSIVGSAEVLSAKAIRAILLAEKFHPLLEHPDLFSTLNNAASQQTHNVPMSFECWRIDNFDSDTGPSFIRIDV